MTTPDPTEADLRKAREIAYATHPQGQGKRERMRAIATALAAKNAERDEARHSLAQEIAGALTSRGFFAPKDCASSDLIGAVGMALDRVQAERDRLAAEVERAKGLLADAREHVSFRKHLCPSVEAGPLLWSINDFLTHRQEGNAGAEDDKIEDSSPGGEREAFEAWWCDRCGCDELDTLKSRLAEVEARAEELAGKLGDAAHRMERGKDLLERIRAQLPPMNPDEPKTVVRRVREVVADRDRLAAEVERAKVLLGRVELRDGQKMAGVREDIDAWFTQRQEGNAGAEDDKIEEGAGDPTAALAEGESPTAAGDETRDDCARVAPDSPAPSLYVCPRCGMGSDGDGTYPTDADRDEYDGAHMPGFKCSMGVTHNEGASVPAAQEEHRENGGSAEVGPADAGSCAPSSSSRFDSESERGGLVERAREAGLTPDDVIKGLDDATVTLRIEPVDFECALDDELKAYFNTMFGGLMEPSSPGGEREGWSTEDYERGRRYYELSHRRDWSKNPASIKGNYIRAAKALWDEARSRVAQDEVRGRVCLAVAGAAHDAGLYPFKTTGEKDLFDACHGACIAAFDSLGIPAPAPGTLQMEAHYDPAPSLPSRDKVKAALCDATEDAHTDNLAVVLASYYEKSIHRPKPDPIDQELGWSRWCMEQSDAALDRLIDAVLALRGKE